MDKRDKVIQALACSAYRGTCPPDCPCEFRLEAYKANTTCDAVVAYYAMQMLKEPNERETTKPEYEERGNMVPVYKCGNCHKIICTASCLANYCWNCGREVNWVDQK